ncbi:MAG: hypothetical protein GY950_22310 [bacterium]|nr:hypothetical protein [bacterium]
MVTKEQIIADIKRVADMLGVKTLKRKEFEKYSTIPPTTLRYYMGSWSRALKEAGLEADEYGEGKQNRQPAGNDDLLKDLIRIYNETGETPTAALVAERGKYDYRYYSSRWKSIGEAFNRAMIKFPPKPRDIDTSTLKILKTEPPAPENPSDFSDLGIYQDNEDEVPLTERTGTVEIPFAIEKGNEFSEVAHVLEEPGIPGTPEVPEVPGVPVSVEDEPLPVTQTITLIPKTIKPKKRGKRSGRAVERGTINFRGLKSAPVNAKGVAYMFGMIGRELGFLVEEAGSEFADCEGKRCLDIAGDRWVRVSIYFEYKSSDFKTRDYAENGSPILVCWRHDREDCPVEVLELRSTIKLFGD